MFKKILKWVKDGSGPTLTSIKLRFSLPLNKKLNEIMKNEGTNLGTTLGNAITIYHTINQYKIDGYREIYLYNPETDDYKIVKIIPTRGSQ